MGNVLSTVGFLAVIGLLAWVGWGLEPHWASKDGRKFMCRMQLLPTEATDKPRWHDVKVAVDESELIVLARSRHARDLRGGWRIVGAVNDDQRKRRVYELRGRNDDSARLRVPLHSRCVAVLDPLVP